MKNNIGLLVLFLSIIAVSSCSNEDDYEAPFGDFATFSWWSSPTPNSPFDSTTKGAKLNRFLAFQDFSRNALTHEWRISEGSAFISTNALPEDSLRLASLKRKGLTSTSENLVFVLFEELGTSQVTIKNTYRDSISGAINIDNVWTAEQVINVNVTE